MKYILDVVICLILIYGFYKGFKKGFFDEITYLLSLIFAIYGAIHISYDAKKQSLSILNSIINIIL